MVPSAESKHIALLFPLAVPHLAEFMDGVVDYARNNADWRFTTNPSWTGGFPETFAMSIHGLRGWYGDGAIAVITREEEAHVARRLSFPVVNLSGTLEQPCGVPRVMVDHEAIGRTAARHFLAKGFKRFAYYGMSGVCYGRLRRQGFSATIRDAGYELDACFETPPRTDPDMPWVDQLDELAGWLGELQPPTAMLAINDYRACIVMEQCDRMGIGIPQEIALLGVDDDEIVCRHCHPPLSSVSRNGRTVGYHAAGVLDALIGGAAPPPVDLLVPPGEVVQRESSNTLAIEHPQVAASVQLIHENLHRPYGVKTLLGDLGVSRRFLERVFLRELGCTPHEYLTQRRIERAVHLLEHRSDLSIEEIAVACGQPDPRNFRRLFRRRVGMSPNEYRRQDANSPSGER